MKTWKVNAFAAVWCMGFAVLMYRLHCPKFMWLDCALAATNAFLVAKLFRKQGGF